MYRNFTMGSALTVALAILMPLKSYPQEANSTGRNHKPRIGIALSGGGARGAAHVGVLQVLEQTGVRPDFIAGTSFGALVGGLFAAGYSATDIEKMLTAPGWEEIFQDQPVRAQAPLVQARNLRYLARLKLQGPRVQIPAGLLGGQKLMELLDYYTTEAALTAHYDFDRLPIRFRAVATDLITGKPYLFREGRLSEAIRASLSVPGLFAPWRKNGMILVDGCLADNLPTDVAREMGAEYVIAVDVTEEDPSPDQVQTIIDVTSQCLALLAKQSVRANYKHADLVLRPDLGGFKSGSYPRMKEIIQCGVASARAHEETFVRLARGKNQGPPNLTHGNTPTGLIESIACNTNGQIGASSRLTPACGLPQISTRPNESIDLKKLSTDLQRLRASNRFDSAGYELEPLENGRYRLRFHLTESALRDVGVGLQYIRDSGIQALMEFNTRNLLGTPSYSTVSTRFGSFQQLSASVRLIHPGLQFLFLEPQIERWRLERRDYGEKRIVRTFVDERRTGQISAGMNWSNRIEASVGFRVETADYFLKGSRGDESKNANMNGLRLRARLDTLDAQEFPRRGTLIDVQGDYRRRSFGADTDHQLWQANFGHFFSYSDLTAIGIRLAGVTSAGALPHYEHPSFGGDGLCDGPSRPLVGYERDQFKVQRLLLAGLSGRRQLFAQPTGLLRFGYIFAEYNAARVQEQEHGRPALVHGGAIGFSLDTIGGPIRVAVGFNQEGKAKFYLALGPSF